MGVGLGLDRTYLAGLEESAHLALDLLSSVKAMSQHLKAGFTTVSG